ncbi:MAG: serine/threonine-protein kinase [Leptolyngbyaceae bacterium]|nr:serine/threonine-protein kinase [Leptolyngbyaceae bacterium]
MSYPLTTELKRPKYRLLGLVGQGQFGRVYCAIHRKTGRLVALKDLDRQRFPTHQFLRELRFLLSLQHPNIVACQALDHTRTGRYLVMDYCEGGTLRNLMEQDRALTLTQCLQIVADTLAGLHHAHTQGIVHCDIKPENILLRVNSKGWQAQISDFGIAQLSKDLNHAEGNIGSPAYMAPERFYGQYSHTSDLYAVGILLFELLVGERPFSGVPTELMSAHLNQALKIPTEIPEALQSLLRRSLQKLPARRFPSAQDMLGALQAATTELGLGLGKQGDSVRLPLYPSDLILEQCPFQSLHQQTIQEPISILASSSFVTLTAATGCPAILYKVVKTPLVTVIDIESVQSLSDPLQVTTTSLDSLVLSEEVEAVIVRPPACFLITAHSIYGLPIRVTRMSPSQLANFSANFLCTLDPQGRWMAILSSEAENVPPTVKIWQLNRTEALQLSSPRIVACPLLNPKAIPFQLIALDPGHGAVLSRKIGHQNDETLCEVFTRRGTLIGSWCLSVSIQQAIASSVPYKLFATEASNPQSLLLIDLKPFRVVRINLEMQPKFFAATPWGCVVTGAQGQMILLDLRGDRVGWIAPILGSDSETTEELTALTVLNQYTFLLATWNAGQGQGSLYTVDLRQCDIDLVF